MIYEIKKYGEAVLREVAQEVENIDNEILEILDNMVETMHEAKGVGLAAPQVGISKRMFVCDQGDGVVRKVINPIITPMTDKLMDFEEGCLSVPGIYKKVQRPEKIKIDYLNEKGEKVSEEVEGFLAIIMQHEFDHLEGKMFIDHLSALRKQMIKGKLNNMLKGKARCAYKVKTVK